MTNADVKVLLDSNVLLSLADKQLTATAAVRALAMQGYQLILAPQNIVEYYGSATRPLAGSPEQKKPGKGLSPQVVLARIARFRRKFVLLEETSNVLENLLELVQRHRVVGRQVHDCRLAAFCLAHNIPHILTYDKTDFNRFTHLQVLHPDNIASKGIN